jgi:uncharacterized membrane protein
MAVFKAISKLDKVFAISIVFKALDGLLEAVGGVALLIIRPDYINKMALRLTHNALSNNPHNFIASHFLHSAQGLAASGGVFASLYLLSHGVTKIVLVIEILREHLWAYKGMVAFLGIFIVYQLYLMIYRPSYGLVILTLFDGLIVWLTLREEERQKRFFKHAEPKTED